MTNLKKVLKGMPKFLEMQENKKPLEMNRGPQYLMMNLETDCPFNCGKCAQPGRNRKMDKPLSLAERENIIIMSAKIGIKELVIIGAGEPTSSRNFERIVQPVIEIVHKKGMGTIMFTTALGINKEQAEFYRDHNVTIFVSLDSLNPETYKKITGNGNLVKILENIQVLRDTYKDTQETLPNGRKLIRLAINVTIQKDNVGELDEIKKFTGSDMQFIANTPMPEGKLRNYNNWRELVGDNGLEEFKRIVIEKSDTGSHSSIADGICSYFNRGIAVDSDGQLLTCGYASDSAFHLDNIREGLTSQNLLEHYEKIRKGYMEWCQKIGHTPSCPLRDAEYEDYISSLKNKKRKGPQPTS